TFYEPATDGSYGTFSCVAPGAGAPCFCQNTPNVKVTGSGGVAFDGFYRDFQKGSQMCSEYHVICNAPAGANTKMVFQDGSVASVGTGPSLSITIPCANNQWKFNGKAITAVNCPVA
ncbi:hypothetical protein FO519_010150, partial [Halicephalobus sp. NKZ332]